MTIPRQFQAGGALLGAAIIYASFGLLIRILSEMYGDFAQVTARFLLAAAIMLVIRAVTKNPLSSVAGSSFSLVSSE